MSLRWQDGHGCSKDLGHYHRFGRLYPLRPVCLGSIAATRCRLEFDRDVKLLLLHMSGSGKLWGLP
jgi:hypothetical protein